MHSSLADIIHGWHDFYVLVGTASATLVGLMFVAASVGAQVFTERNREAMRAFISPTVVHFSSVLFICIVAAVPSQTWRSLAVLSAVVGVAGAIHAARVWVQLFVRHSFAVDVIDRLFYALLPVAGYLLVIGSAVLLLVRSQWSLEALAGALITLLLAGLRNAWDMTMWIIIRVPVTQFEKGSAP
ncbi:MAG TPA: hypothetical protein VH678_23190 [Xanthobacteraceae bacterium]|jgi:hypothetical protein